MEVKSKIEVSDELGMASVSLRCMKSCVPFLTLSSEVHLCGIFFWISKNQHFMTKWENPAVLFLYKLGV